MADVVYVGDTDLSTLNFSVTSVPGWANGPVVQRPRYPTLGRAGGQSGSITTTPGRAFSVGGILTATSVATRDAKLATLMDNVSGIQDWRFGDSVGKFIRAELVGTQTQAFLGDGGGFSARNPNLTVGLDLFADYPHRLDVDGTVVAFSTAGATFTGGTEDSGGVIEIIGSSSAPSVTVKDWRGDQKAAIGLSATVATGASLEIDLDRRTITSISATGGRTDSDSKMTSTGAFFRLNRDWWDYGASVGCTLTITSGTARLLTRKSYQT